LAENNKVVKFKKRKNINIGIVVFLILFLYIAINVYMYMTKDKLTIYEVQEGSTAIDNRITGLILRQEKLVYPDQAGYVAYYQKDGARVAKNAAIYSISSSPPYNAQASDSEPIKLSAKNKDELKHEIQTFYSTFSNNKFDYVYSFKDNIQETIQDIVNGSLISDGQASDLPGNSGASRSSESGIVSYYMDNFETVTSDSVTEDMFKEEKYQKTNLRTMDKVSIKTPIYKIISSDYWKIVLPLTSEQYNKLEDKEQISFTILQNDINMTANLALVKKASDYYAVLTMNKDLPDYLSERYIDVKLNFDSAKGLKIPLSTIVEKDFYEVPLTYFTQGGDSTQTGLVKEVYNKKGEVEYPFVATRIYYQDKTNAYVDAHLFEAGTKLQSPSGEKQFTLSKTIKLKGVYNVNQGYAVFRRIEILYQNDEYCIVKDNTSFGLSAYDHIALNGKAVVNQAIIY
jgi:hypothetical protein